MMLRKNKPHKKPAPHNVQGWKNCYEKENPPFYKCTANIIGVFLLRKHFFDFFKKRFVIFLRVGLEVRIFLHFFKESFLFFV